MAHRVVCSIGIAIVVRVLVDGLVGMNPVAIGVERVVADSPAVIGGVDEMSPLVLMGGEMDRVARMHIDFVAWTAHYIVRIVACGIGKALPGGAIGAVVLLCAGKEDNCD